MISTMVCPHCVLSYDWTMSPFSKKVFCVVIYLLCNEKKKPDEKKNQNEKFIEKTKIAEKNDNNWNCILMS